MRPPTEAALLLLRRSKPGRGKPIVDLKSGFGLASLAKKLVPFGAVRQFFSLCPETLGFLIETIRESQDVFKTTTLHVPGSTNPPSITQILARMPVAGTRISCVKL
jgi:hypothetical protein